MTRTTVTPVTPNITIDIPPDYIGKQIEVLVYALDEVKPTESKTKKTNFAGALKLSETEYQNFKKHVHNIRNEWD